MPVTNYISVNGRMLSEVTDGVILDYVPDALGSIHSVVDQTATAVKTMRYKPYGEVLSRSGSISDRMYQWVGTYGYRATFNYASSHYVRARHYSQTPGSWTTVDPLWPDERAYAYVDGSAIKSVDPTGTSCQIIPISIWNQERLEQECRECGALGSAWPSRNWKPAYSDAIKKAAAKYCKGCPNLTPDDLECRAFEENYGKPGGCTRTQRPHDDCSKDKNFPHKDCNCGFFQISPDIWKIYGCDKEFGPYIPGVWDASKNIGCAVMAMCKGGASGGMKCGKKWGTETGQNGRPPGDNYSCCKKCKAAGIGRALAK